eukprot:TRINITY_DN9717_c0_g1_i1.p1 TRINITY_DN9717_c0_g1~~TRINITY_DN9717_c0_g1_i1.p1  ORF type:complete len:525 (-),score=123.96 TRINITY_DN9717_c0_g1_i1:667-2241(-)
MSQVAKKKRVTTVEERKGIIEDSETMSYNQVAQKYQVSYSAVKKIIQRKRSYTDLPETMKKRKSVKGSSFSTLNDAVYERYCLLALHKFPIFSKDLKLYGKKFAEKLRVSFNPSDQWLDSFLGRYQLRLHQIDEDSGLIESRDSVNVDPSIRFMISKYSREDIYCADEAGLYFRASPAFLVPDDDRYGIKLPEERVTVLLCSNMTGTTKLPPVVIGSSPSPFEHMPEAKEKVGVSYFQQEYSWMTTEIFQGFVQYLDANMLRPSLLVIDDAPIHKVEFVDLRNLRIIFLPSQGSLYVQPFEAGIFDAFKRNYRKNLLQLLLERVGQLDETHETHESHDVLLKRNFTMDHVLPLVRDAWDSVSNLVVRNSWRISGLVDMTTNPMVIESYQSQIAQENDEILSKIKTLHSLGESPIVSAEDYLVVDQSVSTMEIPSEDEMIDAQIRIRERLLNSTPSSHNIHCDTDSPFEDGKPKSQKAAVPIQPTTKDALRSVDTLINYFSMHQYPQPHMESLLAIRSLLYDKSQ